MKKLRSKLKEHEWSGKEQGSSNKGITSNDVNDDVHLYYGHLDSFPVTAIKYSDKCSGREEGFILIHSLRM